MPKKLTSYSKRKFKMAKHLQNKGLTLTETARILELSASCVHNYFKVDTWEEHSQRMKNLNKKHEEKVKSRKKNEKLEHIVSYNPSGIRVVTLPDLDSKVQSISAKLDRVLSLIEDKPNNKKGWPWK